ncbi:methyltransferase domain-containing protein [Pseudomonas chlororaphis]|uniref:methyltransferase domain-containing protein n=1 Tax=Pseudomonas chlororaphis TaxID=587753 RepID=UPI0004CFCB09|nr:methyltransferase domain-containing protein [Pseudomonas chlororaphis]AZD29881.1 hypothetical protein C4K23_3132 [Pseudomonas chlororaphis]
MTNFNSDIYPQARVQKAAQPMPQGSSQVANPVALFLETPYSELWSRNFGSPVVSLAITPDAALLAVACRNRQLTVLTQDYELRWSQRFADDISAIAISPGCHVAVGTQRGADGSGSVYLFDAEGQELFSAFLASAACSVSLTADGSGLTITCKNQTRHLVSRVDNRYQLSQAADRHQENTGHLADSGHADIVLTIKGRVLCVLDQHARHLATHELPDPALKCALSHDANAGIVALENGAAALVHGDHPEHLQQTAVITSRGISSVAISRGGTAVVGSPAGTLHVLNRQGKQLWSRQVDGEVWATAISENGSLVVSGCTDGTVKWLANHAHDACNGHMSALQLAAERLPNPSEQLVAVTETLASLGQMGLSEYAVNWLHEGSLGLSKDTLEKLTIKLLSEEVQLFPRHYTSHFLLAQAYQRHQDWHQAARHFTWAGQDERMKLKSFTLAGESFLQAGLNFAAKSAFRRARELTVTEEAKKTIYTLGRIHEEQGSIAEAQKYYEVVFTLSPNYLDVCARLKNLNQQPSPIASPPGGEDKDWYASLILDLLKPASQRDFDLGPQDCAVHPRTTELASVAEHRKRLLSVLAEFSLDNVDKAADARLDYDVAAYMRYDCSVPEDEAKKSLELVNMLDCLKHYGPFRKSLDIGAATGRYPTLLAQQGIQAFGVDLEPMAVEYARQKTSGALNPHFHQGDARALPFESTQFDLITCMMGTAAHFPRQDFPTVMSEIHRCLVPGGYCVISTWDIECPHLTYLSIYSHEQKELMRQNAVSRADVSEIATAQGFVVEEIRALGLFPESLGYELDLQQEGPGRIRNLLDMDLAFKAKFPNLHGQMYMLIVRKA